MKQISILVAAFLVLVFSSVSFAASCGGNPSNCNCTDTVTANAVLDKNLTCPGDGLVINTGVTLDCAGYKISGNETGTGISIGGSTPNIKNCEVSAFNRGIDVTYSATAVLINNTIHSNTGYGIYTFGQGFPNGVVMNDTILHNNANDFFAYKGSTDGSITVKNVTFRSNSGVTPGASLNFHVPTGFSDNTILMDFSPYAGSPDGYVAFGNRYLNISGSWGGSFFGSINWTWSDGEDDSGVKLFRKNSSGDWNEVASTLDTDNNQLSVTNHPIPSSRSFIYALFWEDLEAPIVTILLPTNSTYDDESVPLNFTATDNAGVSSCWYSLDGGDNITLPDCTNTSLDSLPEGGHNVTVYANDSEGNVGFDTEWFTTELVYELISGCRIINMEGNYLLDSDLEGANISVSDLDNIANACIYITSTNVILDCGGHKITNDGTSEAAAIVLKNANGTTVKNCPSLSLYEEGLHMEDSDRVDVLDSASQSNTGYGIYSKECDLPLFSGLHLYNNSNDFRASVPSFVYKDDISMNNVIIDNPLGNYENFTNISMEREVEDFIILKWMAQPEAPPAPMVSFNQKYMDHFVEHSAGVTTWHWTDGELGIEDNEENFELWSYRPGSGWNVYTVSPNTTDNSLSIGGEYHASTVAILQNNSITECTTITKPGKYALIGNIYGVQTIPNTCIIVMADNVILDLNGYSIVRSQDPDDWGSGVGISVAKADNFKLIGEQCSPLSPVVLCDGVYGYLIGNSLDAAPGFNIDPVYFCGNTYGVLANQSDDGILTDVVACNNTQYGIYILDSDNVTINSSRTYNNGFDLHIENNLGSPVDLTVTSLVFDNPSGDGTQATEVYMTDSVEPGSSYEISWSGGTNPLPSGYSSFRQKYLEMSTQGGTPSVDTASWKWTDVESSPYDESAFQLLKDAGAGWSDSGAALDTDANSLTLSSFAPAADFGIAYQACTDADGDGYYAEGGECGPVDCNDGNAAVNPGATETCNGVDDDCDASVDESGDSLCDNGFFCDGAEVCSGSLGCQAGTPPSVDDGIPCTADSCNENTDTIVHTADDSYCDNGLYCDGTEFCSATLGCQAGAAPSTDDGIPCTADSCNEGTDQVVHAPDDSYCDNGLFCDGSEYCSATLGCQAGSIPDCSVNNLPVIGMCVYVPDGNPATYDYYPGFTSSCDEENGMCTWGAFNISHTCDVTQCGAECDATHGCADTSCASHNGCYAGTYRVYSDAPNSCAGDCSCTDNSCTEYTTVVTDADSDGYDTECDLDCNDADPAVNPGATELCNDTIDNNCNGLIDGADPACAVVTDADNDGVPDNVDKCLNTIQPEGIPTQGLRPNHFANMDTDRIFETNTGSASAPVITDGAYKLSDTFGCSCEQILYCKPGADEGELKFGCTSGTMGVWTSQSGWAPFCQLNGKVAMAGEQKDFLENTDGDYLWDIIDSDKDNDGVSDSSDSEADSKPDANGNPKGKPDWWCTKHAGSC